MQFAFVSLALLAIAHSLPPGVHGAPAIVPDRPDGFAIRQAPVSPAFLTPLPTPVPTTTSRVSSAATTSTSTLNSVPATSPSPSQTSSTPQSRMRRQLPLADPLSVLSSVLSIIGAQSTALPAPVQPLLSVALSILGSVPTPPAVNPPTPSKPTVGASPP